MKSRGPSKVSTWLLKRGGASEALIGDLTEECARGRSRSWYWRQVVMALVRGRVMLRLLTTATVAVTSAFALVVLMVVPLLHLDESAALVALKLLSGVAIVWFNGRTLMGIWAAPGAVTAPRKRVLLTGAAALSVAGAWGVISNAYSLLVYGEIVSGRRSGDPEYYIPAVALVLTVQGILTVRYLWTRTRNEGARKATV